MNWLFVILISCLLLSGKSEKRFMVSSQHCTNTADSVIHLYVRANNDVNYDSLVLKYQPVYLNDVSHVFLKNEILLKKGVNSEGFYHFVWRLRGDGGYITLRSETVKGAMPEFFFDNYFVERGDHIVLNLAILQPSSRNALIKRYPFGLEFKGTGAEKHNIRFLLDTLFWIAPIDYDYLRTGWTPYDEMASTKLEKLKTYKNSIGPMAYKILLADVVGDAEMRKLLVLSSRFKDKDTLLGNAYFRKYVQDWKNGKGDYRLSDSIKAISYQYSSFLLKQARLIYKRTTGSPTSVTLKFAQMLDSLYDGYLKEKLITMLCVANPNVSEEGSSILKESLRIVKDSYLRSILDSLSKHRSNKAAPDFALPDAEGNTVSLRSFRGKVVLIDFWFTGCYACAMYYQQHLKEVEEFFKDNPDVVFLTISIDRDREEWLNSLQEGKYTSDQSINLYTAGLGPSHKVIADYKTLRGGYPFAVLIGRDGNVLLSADGRLRHRETLRAEIEKALSK